MPPRVQFTHGPGIFLREKRSSRVNLRVFYAQFTLGSPHSFIYLGPGGAIKSAINHLNIGPGLREGESLRLPGPIRALGWHLPEGLFTPGAARPGVNNPGNCRLVRVIYLRIL